MVPTPSAPVAAAAGRATLVELWDAFGAGLYLLFFLTHLDLYRRRRRYRAHLYLGLASFGALVVDVTGMILRRLAPVAPLPVTLLNLFGVALAAVCLVDFARELAAVVPRRGWRWVRAGFLAAPAAAAFFPPLTAAFLAATMALLAYAGSLALRAPRQGAPEVVGVAYGFLVLMACLILDLSQELGLLPLPQGIPILGFIALFLTATHSLNRQFEREERASRTDPLTGLANRRGFYEAWEEAERLLRRAKQPISLILLDLDNFKLLNDRLGHAAGDEVLAQVGNILRLTLRGQDTAARWGGDEFIVLLPNTPIAGAVVVAEKLRVALVSLPQARSPWPLSVSFGVAEHVPLASLEETVARADAALYQAKAQGCNAIVCA